MPKGTTVLEAARAIGIMIPTLCYMKGINEIGACRVCLVEIEGINALQASCVLPIGEGMVIHTDTARVQNAVRNTVELILANHNQACDSCFRNQECVLQNLTETLGIEVAKLEGQKRGHQIENLSASIVRDAAKCILCGRCVATCKEAHDVGILQFAQRGFNTTVAPAINAEGQALICDDCGQCIAVCPVAALREKTASEKLEAMILNPENAVIAELSGDLDEVICEALNMPAGTSVKAKWNTALKEIGFKAVFEKGTLDHDQYALQMQTHQKRLCIVSVLAHKTRAAEKNSERAIPMTKMEITVWELAEWIRHSDFHF